MRDFKHHNATSVDEAMALMNHYGGRASLIAGGTDLLGVLKDEILQDYPDAVINIKTIPDLDCIEEDDKGLQIGALVKLGNVARSALVKKDYGLLSQAAEAVATPEIRNMATLGGNLCQDTRCWYYRYPHSMGGRILCHRKGSGPCHAIKGDNRYHAIMGGKACFAVSPSDTAIALTALNAELDIAGPKGVRKIPINAFFDTLGTKLESGEILTGIHVPKPLANSKQTFLKFTLRKPVDFALVSVASVMAMDDGICKSAKIALGAIAPTPVRAAKAEASMEGKPVNQETAREAADLAMERAKPLSMNAYKVQITKTLIKRALLD